MADGSEFVKTGKTTEDTPIPVPGAGSPQYSGILVPHEIAMEKARNHETTKAEGADLVSKTERSALRRHHDEDLGLCLPVPLQIGQMPRDCAHIHCVVWGGLITLKE